MKIKKLKKKNYSEKKPTKSWTMSAKSDKFFYYSKRKKTTKSSWPMSAKSDTWLPGSIYNKIRIFWIGSKNFISWDSGTDRESEGDEKYGVEESHVFELWRFEGESQISIFYRANILSKTFIPYCNHDCLKIFPHSFALLGCNVVYKNAFLWN